MAASSAGTAAMSPTAGPSRRWSSCTRYDTSAASSELNSTINSASGRPANRGHRVLQAALLAGEVDEHLVHQFNGRRPRFQADAERVEGGRERVELRHEQSAVLRPRNQGQLRLGDDRERALGADEEWNQRSRIATEGGARRGSGSGCSPDPIPTLEQPREVVPAHLSQDLRACGVDLGGVLAHRGVGGAVGIALARPQFELPLVFRRRERAELSFECRRTGNRQGADVIDRLPVDDRARAGGVVADHAAERGPAGGRDVRAEHQPELRQPRIEVIEHDAGLQRDRASLTSTSPMAFRYFEQSMTSPGPMDWPDRLVPPPRAVIGTPRSAAISTAVARSSSVLGITTPSGWIW